MDSGKKTDFSQSFNHVRLVQKKNSSVGYRNFVLCPVFIEAPRAFHL